MKDKFIIFFGILLLFLPGCTEEGGNLFNKILSKTVESFSPKTESKAELVTIITAAEEKAEEVTEGESTPEDTLETIAETLLWEKIYYSDRERPDPFRPLLGESEEQEKKVNVDLAELVGIIWGKNGYLALLKEGNLGYVLKTGDKVTDGRVVDINEESITFLLTRFGESNRVTLRLKKEER